MTRQQTEQKRREYDSFAKWYDLVCARTDDTVFYTDLARSCGRTLELGCGTGRITCELARAGVDVVGIDISGRQLAVARDKKYHLPRTAAARVEFRRGNITKFNYRDRFDLVIAPCSTIFELPGSVARMAAYRKVHQHLNADGVFAFDAWFKGEGKHTGWGKGRPHNLMMFFGSYPHPTDPGITLYHFEAQKYASENEMVLTVIIDQVGPDRVVKREAIDIKRHYVSPEDTLAELKDAGFRKIALYGGFQRQRLYDPTLAGRGRAVYEAQR
jgi:SAM-dependent methyltransferase